MARARSIRESDDVEKLIDAHIAAYPRLEELWDGWKWRLARSPLLDATPLSPAHPGWYLVVVPDLGIVGLPKRMTIMFHVTDEWVNVQSLRLF